MELIRSSPFYYFWQIAKEDTKNKKMKKTLFTAFITLCVLGVYAQGNPVTSAYRYMQNEEFNKAVAKIEEATKDAKQKTKSKTWHYRGIIYTKIATMRVPEMGYRFQYPDQADKNINYAKTVQDPIGKAVASFKKVKELGDESRNVEIDNNMITLATLALNEGVANWKTGFNENGEVVDPNSFKESYNSYNLFLNIYSLLSNQGSIRYNQRLAESNITIQNLKITRANAAYYGKLDPTVTKGLFQELVNAKIEDYLIYRNYSSLLEESGNIEEAKKMWDVATDNFPNNKDIALDEAIFYQKIGEEKELLVRLEDAIKLDPTNASLYNVLGGIYAKMVVESNNAVGSKNTNEKYDADAILTDDVLKKYQAKAIELLDKAIALDPNEVSNFTQKASLFLSEGVAAFNENSNLPYGRPGSPSAIKSQKLTAQYQASFNTALDLYKKAEALQPDNLIALDYMSKIYLWLGNTAEHVKYKNLLEQAKANR